MDKPDHPSLRERFNISRLAIQFPWLTLEFWIVVMVAGLFAFSSLKYALFPDVTFPVVVVNVIAPIETALETETTLTQPIEQTLYDALQREGLGNVRSLTYPGRTIISLSFKVGTDLTASATRIRTILKNEYLTLLPGALYQVTPINLNESAVASYAISSNQQTLLQMTQVAQDRILPELAHIEGVLKVNLLGSPTGAEVNKDTENQASGAVISVPGTSASRLNGQAVLALEVIKRSDANALDVVREVEKGVQRLKATLPAVQLDLATTQSDYIHEATQATIDTLVLAIILSVIVIYPFLWNWKATLISALAIPTSLMGTFIVMAVLGFNLETITLLALALVIGIIVDDAIVDVENIARHVEAGASPRVAAIEATDEIGLTVTAATLTIAAVFLPVGLMTGVVGQFFRPFGITVSAAVLISLLVARTLSPMLAAYWFKPKAPRSTLHPEHDRTSRFLQGYRRLLRWSLHHRFIVVGIAVLSFVAGLALIPYLPKGFIPKLDRGEFRISYTAPVPEALRQTTIADHATEDGDGAAANLPANLPPGIDPASLGNIDPRQLPPNMRLSPDTIAALRAAAASKNAPRSEQGSNKLPNFRPPVPPELDPAMLAQNLPADLLDESLNAAKQLEDYVRESPDVETVFTLIGARQGQPNHGTLYVKLRPDRTLHTAEIQDRLRQGLPVIPNVTTSIEDIPFIEASNEKPLQVALVGDDPAVLSETARTIQQRIERLPGFVDVSITGKENTKDNIVEINRLNRRRVAYVTANLGNGMALGDATDQVVAIANQVKPATVSLDLGGDSARVGEIFGSFGVTLILSIVCVVIVLVLLFRSWIDPLAIAISLPLSIVGALLASLFTGEDFGMISVIGIIFLLGLTSKSAILLIDYINQLRRGGLSRNEAILKAAPIRLRPILMTTAATILGMLPVALGLGAGAELRAPMAIAIIGGLITSTVLSLIVVPVVYALLDDVQTRLFNRRRIFQKQHEHVQK